MTTSRRRLLALISLAAVITLGATAFAFRVRLRELLPIGRTGNAAAAPASPDPVSRPEMSMTNGSPTPAAEPSRGDVAIDTRRQQLIGVRIVPVERVTLATSVRTTGVVRYDETRQTDVNVKIDGWIRDLYVDFTGQPVRRGERLFTLYSPELLATQNEFIFALRNRDQAQAASLDDAREYATRLVDAARQRLSLWDLSPEQLRAIEDARQPIPAITVTAPASGFVLEKTALKGMHVDSGQTLYKIADISSVWVDADVYEQDIQYVRIGARATIALDAYPGQSFTGRAVYVYPTVDPQTRTAKVRFQLPNPGGRLKPGMFANVELRTAERRSLTVPANAVLDSGTQQTVFVATGDGVFTPRPVKTGGRQGDALEVIEGLKEGEQVAASATFFLDSESQLRAGLQNYEAPPAAQGAVAQVTPAPALDIAFHPATDPAKLGDNTFEVAVKDRAGKPIADADVSVQLFMPAMPTMNMPAMRNEIRLPAVGGGVYRGPGQVLMGGRWEATVTVSKSGQRLGTRQFAVVAR
jgi:RND family efflux transporter MFP subunit